MCCRLQANDYLSTVWFTHFVWSGFGIKFHSWALLVSILHLYKKYNMWNAEEFSACDSVMSVACRLKVGEQATTETSCLLSTHKINGQVQYNYRVTHQMLSQDFLMHREICANVRNLFKKGPAFVRVILCVFRRHYYVQFLTPPLPPHGMSPTIRFTET
jgi:hypothetical protein